MKQSIKKQITVVFVGLVLAILIVCLLMNGFFLEKFYIMNKERALEKMYDAVEEAFHENTLGTVKVQEELTGIVEKGNLSIIVIDEQGQDIFWSAREKSQLKGRLIGYLLGQNQRENTVLKKTNQYEIRTSAKNEGKAEYIEMWGQFHNEYNFIMRSPLESIRESVAISNQFLLYVGLAVVASSVLLVWFFSKRIADPILELAMLSKRMADLDFEAKYTSGGKNEIGILGSNFNAMSETLQYTISELKTANNELLKDIEQKEKIETMRTEFLGNVSHELKTPIALIQGYAEGLKEGIKEDQESRDFYCDVIIDEAGKMNQMVKNLLTLNQLEFGNEGPKVERFDVAALIHGVLQSFNILIEQKQVTVNFIQEQAVYVWADEFQVEQVVQNYISNAFNHVEREKIIEIRIEHFDSIAHISIFNTGNPIPNEDIDKIWDKFFKVDKAHTREYGGNGIGLSIVKVIMESFHQKYGVNNYENGVEFWFELDAK
ncbi:MAG: HAMP domain-containing sensor histidine kinase [Lachnospiraceae bacterium]